MTNAVKCFLAAWIGAWVTAVFLPSVLIAYLGTSAAAAAMGTGFERLAATSWKVADDIGPFVKLTIGGFLLISFQGLDRIAPAKARLRYPIGVIIGIAAMLIALAFVPIRFSRGFGVTLTGGRFDAEALPLYLIGGALAGVAFVFGADRCRRRAGHPTIGAAR